MQELMTPAEAIAYLRLDRQDLQEPRESLRWLCRTGQLEFTKIGRYVRFRKAWLDDLINNNAVKRNTLRKGSHA